MGILTALLLALSAFSLVVYPIIRRLGRNGFLFAALAPALAFFVLLPLGSRGLPVTEEWSWVPQLGLDLTLRMDQISWLFALLVTGAGALVLLYCRNYFE